MATFGLLGSPRPRSDFENGRLASTNDAFETSGFKRCQLFVLLAMPILHEYNSAGVAKVKQLKFPLFKDRIVFSSNPKQKPQANAGATSKTEHGGNIAAKQHAGATHQKRSPSGEPPQTKRRRQPNYQFKDVEHDKLTIDSFEKDTDKEKLITISILAGSSQYG